MSNGSVSAPLYVQVRYQAQGATEIRHFWRMSIEFDDELPAVPTGPEGVTVRLASDERNDLREIFTMLRAAFEYVIVDTPPGFTPEVIASIDSSSYACVVCTLGVVRG